MEVNFSLDEVETLDYELDSVENEEFNIEDTNVNVTVNKEHDKLIHRDYPDQHPISAITDLQNTINYINNNLGALGVQLETKQDLLVSGDNIKTINDQSILGQGNIDVGGDVFDNDIILAGNWSQVGNLTKSQTGTKTYAVAGKTSVEVLTDILSQDANPTTVQPSGSISLAHSGNVEVGNTIAISVTTSFNPGSYTYDNATGVTASSYAFTDTKSHSDTNNVGSTTFNSYSLLVEDGTNYTASVAISYTDGNIPHTQLGNEYPAGKITAGTINKTSSAIKGVRYMFNGANTTVKTLNSTNIRALSGANPSNNFNITIPQNCVQVIIAFPKSLNKTLSKVEDVGAFGTDIKARFEKSTVSVEGASSYTAVDYDVWEYLPATTLDANTYRVTMS